MSEGRWVFVTAAVILVAGLVAMKWANVVDREQLAQRAGNPTRAAAAWAQTMGLRDPRVLCGPTTFARVPCSVGVEGHVYALECASETDNAAGCRMVQVQP